MTQSTSDTTSRKPPPQEQSYTWKIMKKALDSKGGEFLLRREGSCILQGSRFILKLVSGPQWSNLVEWEAVSKRTRKTRLFTGGVRDVFECKAKSSRTSATHKPSGADPDTVSSASFGPGLCTGLGLWAATPILPRKRAAPVFLHALQRGGSPGPLIRAILHIAQRVSQEYFHKLNDRCL